MLQCRVCQSSADMLGHTLKQCARCGKAVYCSRECQKADWPEHKIVHGYKGNFDVHITLLSGVKCTIRGCAEKLKISSLKTKIGEVTKVPLWAQTLCVGTRVLRNEETLLHAGVSATSCVTLVVGEDHEKDKGEDDEDDDIPPGLMDSSSDEEPTPSPEQRARVKAWFTATFP